MFLRSARIRSANTVAAKRNSIIITNTVHKIQYSSQNDVLTSVVKPANYNVAKQLTTPQASVLVQFDSENCSATGSFVYQHVHTAQANACRKLRVISENQSCTVHISDRHWLTQSHTLSLLPKHWPQLAWDCNNSPHSRQYFFAYNKTW